MLSKAKQSKAKQSKACIVSLTNNYFKFLFQKYFLNLVKSFLTLIKFNFDSLSEKIKNLRLVINKKFIFKDSIMKKVLLFFILINLSLFAQSSSITSIEGIYLDAADRSVSLDGILIIYEGNNRFSVGVGGFNVKWNTVLFSLTGRYSSYNNRIQCVDYNTMYEYYGYDAEPYRLTIYIINENYIRVEDNQEYLISIEQPYPKMDKLLYNGRYEKLQ